MRGLMRGVGLFGVILLVVVGALGVVRHQSPLEEEFMVFLSTRNRHIYRVNDDGSDLQQLTTKSGIYSYPQVNRNGKGITFVYNDNQLHWMRSDGSNHRTILKMNEAIYNPQWSPDGRWIMFGFSQ